MIRSLKYLSLFLWLFGAGALYTVYQTKGLPHFAFSYTFSDNGDQYNPFAERYYITCTFWGPYGMFTVDARNGRCAWVQMFKEGD